MREIDEWGGGAAPPPPLVCPVRAWVDDVRTARMASHDERNRRDVVRALTAQACGQTNSPTSLEAAFVPYGTPFWEPRECANPFSRAVSLCGPPGSFSEGCFAVVAQPSAKRMAKSGMVSTSPPSTASAASRDPPSTTNGLPNPNSVR